jgi:hypothetical protein
MNKIIKFRINNVINLYIIKIIYLIFIIICIYYFPYKPALFSFIILYLLIIIIFTKERIIVIEDEKINYIKKSIMPLLNSKEIFYYKDINKIYLEKSDFQKKNLIDLLINLPITFIFSIIILSPIAAWSKVLSNYSIIIIELKNNIVKKILIHSDKNINGLLKLINQNIEKVKSSTSAGTLL